MSNYGATRFRGIRNQLIVEPAPLRTSCPCTRVMLWRFQLAAKLPRSGEAHLLLNFEKQAYTADGERINAFRPIGLSGARCSIWATSLHLLFTP